MIVIVCDATREIGYGHLKRCLVLAGIYRKLGLGVTFLMRIASPVVRNMLTGRGMDLVVRSDHGACRAYVLEKKDQIRLVILDHYEIGPDLEKEIFKVLPTLVMDDLCRPHWCHLLVDQTIGRLAKAYENKIYPPFARLLLGTDYILIDPVYRQVKTRADRSHILISFGATDSGKVVLRVLDILEHFIRGQGLVFHIPLSSLSPCLDGVKKRMEKSKLDIRLYEDLPDLGLLYEQCGIAIGATGTSLFERIYCGLQNITIIVAPNQREVGRNIARGGLALCLGEIQTLDASGLTRELTRMINAPASDRELQNRAMGLVDGRGAVRIVKQTTGLISPVSLRLAEKNDLDVLYRWQHEPGARRFFRNTDPPTQKEHRLWFDQALSCEDVRIHMIEWCHMPIGYIRLNGQGNQREISVLISRAFQGIGFAKQALLKIIQTDNQCYTAFIHPENKASIGLFTAVGFQPLGKGGYIYNATP
jgi:UDP-2,4-diacetamido-2,4,6-trideoxy-beta-L-altropyranose hydrolase